MQARTVVDVNDEMLAQRALGTATKRDTVNAALEVAAAIDAERRARAPGSFRDLLDRLDIELIEQDEKDDHSDRVAWCRWRDLVSVSTWPTRQWWYGSAVAATSHRAGSIWCRLDSSVSARQWRPN